MSRAREFADLAGSAQAGGITGKNLIINGAMTVNQRGDKTGMTGDDYQIDRFKFGIGSLGTWSSSQSTTAPDGFGYSLKLDCTTADASPAASDTLYLYTRFEGQNLQQIKKGTASAKSLTLSFWCRCNKTGDIQVNLRDADNTRQVGATVTINSADTWEYKTITFPPDTTGAFTNDNNWSMSVEWWLDSGSDFKGGAVPTAWEAAVNTDRAVAETLALGDNTSNEFYLTGIQLEVGEQATPFEHRSYGDELARCQRYFQIIPSNSAAYTFPLVRHRSATNSYTGSSYYPVTMRTNATITLDTSGSWIHKPSTRQDTGSATVVSSSPSVFTVVATPSTDDSTQYLAFSNNNVEADAEL
jgi:hypothetical protein